MSKRKKSAEDKLRESSHRMEQLSKRIGATDKTKSSKEEKPKKKKGNITKIAGGVAAISFAIAGGNAIFGGDDQKYDPVEAPEPPPLEDVYSTSGDQILDLHDVETTSYWFDSYDDADSIDDELFGAPSEDIYGPPPAIDDSLSGVYNSYSTPYHDYYYSGYDYGIYDIDRGFYADGVHGAYGPGYAYPYKFHHIPR